MPKRDGTRRGPGEGSSRQRADGRWESRAIIDGRRRSFFGANQAEARAKMLRALSDNDRGLPFTGAGQRVGDWLEHWLATSDSTLAPRTRDGYRLNVERHIAPALGKHRLPQLQPHHVEAFMAKMRSDGLSPRTIQYAHAVLRRALTIAERQGYVHRNVARLATPPRLTRPEIEPLAAGETAAFLAHVRPHRLYPLFATAATLGLRQGELLGLTWPDIELDEGTLAVRRTLSRRGGAFSMGETKTRSSRRVLALPAPLVTELRAWRTRQLEERLRAGKKWDGGGWPELVFTTETGGPLDGSALTKLFARQLGEAGVRRVTFHALRHGAATFLLTSGVDLKVVQEILGHSTIAVTAGTYAHVQATLRRDAADRIGRVIFGT